MVAAIDKCRACQNKKLTEFMDLGEQYLSDFRRDDSKPPKYPLVAVFCEDCKLVQLKHTTPPEEMYHDRYGFKSGVSDTIKADLSDAVTHSFQYFNDPSNWLDIASNDGTLLSYVPVDIDRVGIDPVPFLCEQAEEHADRVINDYFKAEYFGKPFDIITSISCFYDMPDPLKFVSEVESILAKRGIWLIQQNYLLTTMELAAVDNFCHEHLEYYTLLALENLLDKVGLEVNEVLLSPVNGGSIRTMVSHKGTFPIDESVRLQRLAEVEAGLSDIRAYKKFAKKVHGELTKLKDFVSAAKKDGKTTCILAASTRGATIWQSAGIDHEIVDFCVERNPAKVGANFSAIGIPILSEDEFRKRNPDYAIIGPWFFANEVIAREANYVANGGTLVVPLPKVGILDSEGAHDI